MTRRALLSLAPVAIVAAAVPVAAAHAAAADPIIELCERYIAAFNEWDVATEQDGGGNFDTLRHKELDDIKAVLQDRIEATPIMSDAGCAAIWRYVWADNYLRDETADFPDVRRWQMQKAHDWAQSRAKVAA